MAKVTVDFIARESDQSQWRMVLVEEGPWPEGGTEERLRRIQDRLYGCIDAAVDGQLAEKYPESVGKPLVIQIHFYDVPEVEVREFFERFSQGALASPSYREALRSSRFVESISFEAKFQALGVRV